MAAIAMKVPELKLSEDEAALLSKNMVNVAQHYNIAPSEKTQAWCALIMALGMIYYPRASMVSKRRKDEQAARVAAKQAAQPATIF